MAYVLMSRPSEHTIELYVRYPSELSEEQKQWIQQWIQKDPEIQQLADWYRSFYQTFDQVEKDRLHNQDKPRSLTLTALKKSKQNDYTFLLAADTSLDQKPGFKLQTVQTFISKQHHTIIRALFDTSSNSTKLYVITDLLDHQDVVLLESETATGDLLVSEPGGQFKLDANDITATQIADWNHCKLHLPIFKIKIYIDQHTGFLNVDFANHHRESTNITVEPTDNVLRINSHDTETSGATNHAVVRSSHHTSIWSFENHTCVIPAEAFHQAESDLFIYG